MEETICKWVDHSGRRTSFLRSSLWSPTNLEVSTLGLQLEELFGEVMEPLGDGAVLEKACHRGWGGLRVFIISPHLLFSGFCLRFSFLRQPPCLPFATMLPYQDGHLAFHNCKRKQTLSSISGFWSWCFITTTKKVANTK